MTTRRQVLAAGATLALVGASHVRAQSPGYTDALARTFGSAQLPALGGLVVGPDGPIWKGVQGVRRVGSAALVRDTDLWHLGSNTKAMTAAIYGRLVDQGKAAWGARLPDLLPDIPMAPAWRETTVEDVMTHSAGLRDATAMGQTWVLSAFSDARPLDVQRRELAMAMLSAPPAGPVGTYAYGNANYVLLGSIIEALTGQTWEAAFADQLSQPLGMASAGFGPPPGDQPWGHRQGAAIAPNVLGSDNPAALGPAGTAHMSLDDYAKFLRELIVDESQWLSASTRAKLLRPVEDGPPNYAGGWLVARGQPWAGGSALTHDGSNTLWYVSTWLAPGIKRAFVAISNDATSGAAACQQLIPRLIETS